MRSWEYGIIRVWDHECIGMFQEVDEWVTALMEAWHKCQELNLPLVCAHAHTHTHTHTYIHTHIHTFFLS